MIEGFLAAHFCSSSSGRRTNSSRCSTTHSGCEANGNRTRRAQDQSKREHLQSNPEKRMVLVRREDQIAKKITGHSVIFPLLRACTHPYLLDAPRDENGEMLVNDDLINHSGKFILLDKMLRKLGETGHKVIAPSMVCSKDDDSHSFRYSSFRHWSFSSTCWNPCANIENMAIPDWTE